MRLRIGTRGSALALWQTDWVSDLLRKAHPGIEIEILEIRTSGDAIQDRPLHLLGGKGLFIKELESALLAETVDIAVHSMKDVPAVSAAGLSIVAMPPRASPFDAMVSDRCGTLSSLPEGARVGTGALRRQFQLLQVRPDLEVVGIRGNVGTRLSKLRDPAQGLDAIILAVAGLERLGLGDEIAQRLTPDVGFIPALGQGAVGVQARCGDASVREVLRAIGHRPTEVCVEAERGVMKALEGDCTLPIAGHAVLDGDEVVLIARLGMPDASEIIERRAQGPAAEAETLGLCVGEDLLRAGGRELMARLAAL
jgi:hydroxymethylbilane synthase